MSVRTAMLQETTMANHPVANIDARAKCVTLVNVYDVEPENRRS